MKRLMLIGTKVCPKCKTIEMILKQKGVDYKYVYGDDSVNAEFILTLGLKTVPALLVNGEQLITNYAEITKYVKEL